MAIRRTRVRRLFVTGGSGFLGRHIVNGPATQRWEVVAPSSRSLDLRHAETVRDAITEWRPSAVIHTAYRRGDGRSIVDASHNVARAADRVGARLVHVSTDALFAGRRAPYTERDRPDPVHQYGRDKADAEAAVLHACPGAAIVRTSLIYGVGEPSGHELAVQRVTTGESDMTFFIDEVRSPVLVTDLAAALVALAESISHCGVVHLGGPVAMSRSELAMLTARYRGWPIDRLRFSTIEESGLTRPGHVVLDSALARSLGLRVRGPSAWQFGGVTGASEFSDRPEPQD